MEFDFKSLPAKEKIKTFRFWLHIDEFRSGVDKSCGTPGTYTDEWIIGFMNDGFMDLLATIDQVWDWDEEHELSVYVKDEYIEKMKGLGYEQSEVLERERAGEWEDEDEDQAEVSEEPGELVYPEQFHIGGAPYFWMSEMPEQFRMKWFYEENPNIKEEWVVSIGCDG